MNRASEIYVICNSGGRSSAYMTERLLKEGGQAYLVTFQNTERKMMLPLISLMPVGSVGYNYIIPPFIGWNTTPKIKRGLTL